MNYLRERNKGYWYVGIMLSLFVIPFFFSMPGHADAAVLVSHTFYPTSSSQVSDICARGTFTERECIQLFTVPDQQTFVVTSIDSLGQGDSANSLVNGGQIRRNNSLTEYTAGQWIATSTNTVDTVLNPSSEIIQTFNFDSVVLSPGTYAFIRYYISGAGNLSLGLATSTGTYSGEWFVGTGNATSSSQGSYANRSSWFQVNGAGYTPNTGITIDSPASGSYLTPFSTTVYVSLSQPTTGNLKLISNFPVNGSTTIGSANGVTAGTYAFPVVFTEKINYQVRAQFYVSGTLYAQSDPKQYQLGGVFFSTSTSPEGTCPPEGLFAGWDSFWCHTTQTLIIPSDSSIAFIKNQYMKIENVFPFSFLFGSLNTVETAITAYQASGTIASYTFTLGNLTVETVPTNAISNRIGSSAKNAIFELEKYLAWFAVVVGAAAIIKTKS